MTTISSSAPNAQFHLSQSPGNVLTSMQATAKGFNGFNPGELGNVLKWKMQMAEEMQKAQLAQMRQQLIERQQMLYEQQHRPSGPSRPQVTPQAPPAFDPRAELMKIANTPTSPGGFGSEAHQLYRLQNALQLMLGGGGGGTHINPSEADLAAAQPRQPSIYDQNRAARPNYNTPDRTMNPLAFLKLIPQMSGSALSKKSGGHIDREGWYYLHGGEDVIPSAKTLEGVMQGWFEDSGPKGKPPTRKPRGSESFKEGTDATKKHLEELRQYLISHQGEPLDWSQLMNPEMQKDISRSPLNEPPINMLLGNEVPDIGFQMGPGAVPAEPGMPESGSPTIQHAEQIRQDTSNPDVHPQQVLDQLASERERLGTHPGGVPPSSTNGIEGLSISESPLSERHKTGSMFGTDIYNRPEAPAGQTSIKKYTLDQSPKNADEAQQRELEATQQMMQAEEAEVKRLSSSSQEHMQYATDLLHYAAKDMNSPAYETLRQMASDRMAMAQQMDRAAQAKQKAIDAHREKLAELQSRVAMSEIAGRSRIGAAEATAAGRRGDQEVQSRDRLLKNLTDLAHSFGMVKGGDPEAQAETIKRMMEAFMMMGGLTDAFGEAYPNG